MKLISIIKKIIARFTKKKFRKSQNVVILYGVEGNTATINYDEDITLKYFIYDKDDKDERCYIRISYDEYLQKQKESEEE